MFVDSTQKIQIVLAGAKNANDMQGRSSYEDTYIGTADIQHPPSAGFTDFSTNGATAVDIVPAPPPGYIRKVKSILINNADTASCTFSIQSYSIAGAAVSKVFWKWVLATLYQAKYIGEDGWAMFTSAGVRQ